MRNPKNIVNTEAVVSIELEAELNTEARPKAENNPENLTTQTYRDPNSGILLTEAQNAQANP